MRNTFRSYRDKLTVQRLRNVYKGGGTNMDARRGGSQSEQSAQVGGGPLGGQATTSVWEYNIRNKQAERVRSIDSNKTGKYT